MHRDKIREALDILALLTDILDCSDEPELPTLRQRDALEDLNWDLEHKLYLQEKKALANCSPAHTN